MKPSSNSGSFAPIAIVGRSCVLPGALSPDELWSAVRQGQSLISGAAPANWGVQPARIMSTPGEPSPDRTWSDRGGYVQGFEAVFDPRGYQLPAEEILRLDPLFQWVLHTGREALGSSTWKGSPKRAGVIIGNLSYPSSSMSRHAEQTWLQRLAPQLGQGAAEKLSAGDTDPRNRFMSGLPAHLLAQGLGLQGDAFALDAACASSLYAIKLACDALHDGRADLMLAGAVNRADDLFLHVGFTALKALSETGQSRPFHAEADGLLPAEGACMFALRRLDDAERDGEKILGVIRGVGLSNDGRDRGLLVPSQSGQARAMQQALASSGLAPQDIDFVECHATGTVVGDATEIASLQEVYGERSEPLPIGSFKANCGHLITAAGGAGLLKMLAAMEAEEMPPTPNVEPLNPKFEGTALRVLTEPKSWSGSAPRRAGVSAFGFGGNNAHLLVEQYQGPSEQQPESREAPFSEPRPEIAVVALGARVGDGQCNADFEQALFGGASRVRPRAESRSGHACDVNLPLRGLRFPPSDLKESLPQQLLLLQAARDAVEGIAVEPERTSALVGMQCDPEIARHGARWRMIEWAQTLGADEKWLAESREGFVPLLGAAGVIGAMPNVVANRLNSQFGYTGPSFSLSSEELSGVRALSIARRALERRELDTALVGAVDLCCEEVHEQAARHVLGPEKQVAGDAAVVLVLKRFEDAQRDGDQVLAILADSSAQRPNGNPPVWASEHIIRQFGHAHAASGLVQVAAGALACARGETSGCSIDVHALGGQHVQVHLKSSSLLGSPLFAKPSPDTSPVLTVNAHRPPPRLQSPSAPSDDTQLLDPPPALPAVRPSEHSQGLPVATHTSPRPAPAFSQGPHETAPTAPMAQHWLPEAAQPAPASGILQQHLAIQQALSAAHQGFLQTQTQLHNQFLELRSRVAAQWLTQPTPSTSIPLPATHAPEPAIPPVSPPIGIDASKSTTQPTSAPPGGIVRGPSFSRQDLEVHASGAISNIFGDAFKHQDGHAIQVRMPEPPLLLADRIVGIDATPDSMELGTVWSETDVREDTWFLHRGRVPAGILIECGQADLFLISYLGIDRLNQGKRAYRLLGCELTYHGGAPGVGDTLHYDIHIDSHAAQGDVRLFFFHSDCHVGQRPIMSVRNGQAGFFTEKELADSAGVLWSPEDESPATDARLDVPRVLSQFSDFDEERVRAFAQGDVFGCFGPGFERGQTHTDTPSIQDGDLNFIDRIEGLDPRGGPWGRGYARAITDIHPDDWFFDGHFKNDPCMPGTLMFEGCLQLMAFYVAALGHTLDRDGWRFEPVPEVKYQLHCRGQVVPTSKQLVCEIFVEEVWDGPEPTIFAHLLGTVDGKKAFHARHVGLRLVPDWPLASRPELLNGYSSAKPVASSNGFEFGYPSLLACAWGKPSEAFGPMYEPFDGTRRVARLPGPPYHFMSRVTQVDGPIGGFEPGAEVEIEYDVPPDAWYFRENGAPSMPFAVLLEVALQPCGWLASYVGSALTSENDLSFRNLDGKGTIHAVVGPDVGTIRTHSKLTNISQSGDMIIQSFEVICHAGDQCIYTLSTVFGFFPAEALANQIGLPTSDAQRGDLTRANDFDVDITKRPARFCGGAPRLAEPMLSMLDRVTSFEPDGGEAGLGKLRCEKDVDPSEWFFKAHFFQDPVQPGSLGIEVMLQLLQFYMLSSGMLDDGEEGTFEPIESGQEMSWKYRGQVVPENKVITTTLEITERGRDERGQFARGDASLWVDGKRIYEARGLGMRVVVC